MPIFHRTQGHGRCGTIDMILRRFFFSIRINKQRAILYGAMKRRTNTDERKTMAHTVPEEPATVSQNETKQQRKKQAKKEAKMMLKVEAAKKDVQKAEQKVAKAQATLEACRTHLRNLEEKLSLMRATAHASQNGRQATDTYAHSS